MDVDTFSHSRRIDDCGDAPNSAPNPVECLIWATYPAFSFMLSFCSLSTPSQPWRTTDSSRRWCVHEETTVLPLLSTVKYLTG